MATNANFRVAGTAVYNGTFKPHFSNHEIEARSRVLTRNGFKDVKFIRLPRRMSKPAAVAYLIETRPDLFSKRELELLAKRIEGTRYHKALMAKKPKE